MGRFQLRLGVNEHITSSILTSTVTVNSVVGLGYEDTFGPYRRIIQHAL